MAFGKHTLGYLKNVILNHPIMLYFALVDITYEIVFPNAVLTLNIGTEEAHLSV